MREPIEKTDLKIARLFKVVSDAGDYLTANRYDGTRTGANVVKVAKPYLLQRTPFDGLTVHGITYTYSLPGTRSATDGSTTETQKITPDYQAGDLIYAVRRSGAKVAGLAEWVDLNNDGRCWAKT